VDASADPTGQLRITDSKKPKIMYRLKDFAAAQQPERAIDNWRRGVRRTLHAPDLHFV
jgi:hypothetical protein